MDTPSFNCRYYEQPFPEVDDVVMVQVKSIAEMGAYVSLLEYNGIDGMILLSELSRRRIRSVQKLIKVGRSEPVMVLRVDKEKGYIDLSKRRVSPEDAEAAWTSTTSPSSCTRSRGTRPKRRTRTLRTFTRPSRGPCTKSTATHTRVSAKCRALLRRSFRAIEISGAEGEAVLTPEVRDALIKDIKRRMTPVPLKIRADMELTCFHYDGILHIQEAIRCGERMSTPECTVQIKLLAPPLYVLTTQTIDRAGGVETLMKAVEAVKQSIESNKGKLLLKEGARAVSERDEKLLKEQMSRLEDANRDVDGDGSEEEYQEGMGDIDVENASGLQV